MAGVATAAQPASPAAVPGPAGARDASFGKDGKVTVGFPSESAGSSGPQYELPFEFTPGDQKMALAPGGKVVVAGAPKIVRFLDDGKLDPTFGKGGVVRVPRPTGGVFVLSGVAVDSLGRVVVVGLTRPLPTNSTPDPVISSATVMRFTADGKPDPTFGTDGLLITDLGLGNPAAAARHLRRPLDRAAQRGHRLAEPDRRQRRLRDRTGEVRTQRQLAVASSPGSPNRGRSTRASAPTASAPSARSPASASSPRSPAAT